MLGAISNATFNTGNRHFASWIHAHCLFRWSDGMPKTLKMKSSDLTRLSAAAQAARGTEASVRRSFLLWAQSLIFGRWFAPSVDDLTLLVVRREAGG